jgi:serine/threonine protein kinase
MSNEFNEEATKHEKHKTRFAYSDHGSLPAVDFYHDRYDWQGHVVLGGMGDVLRVRDKHLHRDLALKILKPELVFDDDAYQRFIEEAQIGGQLQHPGVAPVYDIGRLEDGRMFFTMKWISGRTLAEEIRGCDRLFTKSSRCLILFEHLCQAIGYAHARGVVHCDLKTSNVMLGEFGEVQVIDWGIAKIIFNPSVQSNLRTVGHAGDGSDERRMLHQPGIDSDSSGGGAAGLSPMKPSERLPTSRPSKHWETMIASTHGRTSSHWGPFWLKS